MTYSDSGASFGECDQEALRKLVRLVLRPGCRILEVGSWLGEGSTRVIIEELRSVAGGKLYCVDTWEGSKNVMHHRDIASRYNVFEIFLQNVRVAGGDEIVNPIEMCSRDAAATVEDGSMDLVFIDADHSYASTKEDISLWKSKVREGGILCGHDCECRPDGILRDLIRSSIDKDHISGAGTHFEVIHPGVVVAVDEAFNGSATLWAETPFPKANGTYDRATLWHIIQPVKGVRQSNRPSIDRAEVVPLLIGHYSGYNMVSFAGFYYAVPQSLGPLDLSQLGGASMPRDILTSNSYEGACLEIVSVQLKSLHKHIDRAEVVPRLVGHYSGYNIVSFAGFHYAVPQSLGPLDLSLLGGASMPRDILTSNSYEGACLEIVSVQLKSLDEHIDRRLNQLLAESQLLAQRISWISNNPLFRIGRLMKRILILKRSKL